MTVLQEMVNSKIKQSIKDENTIFMQNCDTTKQEIINETVRQYSAHPQAKKIFYVTEKPMQESIESCVTLCFYFRKNLQDYLHEFVTCMRFAQIVVTDSQTVLRLMFHGFLRMEEISCILLESVDQMVGNHLFTIVMSHFYIPLLFKSVNEQDRPRIIGFSQELEVGDEVQTQKSLRKIKEQQAKLCCRLFIFGSELEVLLHEPTSSTIRTIICTATESEKIDSYSTKKKRVLEMQKVFRELNEFEAECDALVLQLGLLENCGVEAAYKYLCEVEGLPWFVEAEMIALENLSAFTVDCVEYEKLKMNTSKYRFFEEYLNSVSEQNILVVCASPSDTLYYLNTMQGTKLDTRSIEGATVVKHEQNILILISENDFELFIEGKLVPDCILILDYNDSLLFNVTSYAIDQQIETLVLSLDNDMQVIAQSKLLQCIQLLKDPLHTKRLKNMLSTFDLIEKSERVLKNECKRVSDAILCLDNAFEVLQLFCSSLPKKAHLPMHPHCETKRIETTEVHFQTTITLPKVFPLHLKSFEKEFVGSPEPSKKQSVKSAALYVCSLLVDAELLDFHLMPVEIEDDFLEEEVLEVEFNEQVEAEKLGIHRVLPTALSQVAWNGIDAKIICNPETIFTMHLSIVETRQSQEALLHSNNSKYYCSSPENDILNTFSSNYTFGICTLDPISNIPMFNIRSTQVSILSVAQVSLTSSQFQRLLWMQPHMFHTLLQKQIKTQKKTQATQATEIKRIIDDDKKYMYLICPMIREGVESISPKPENVFKAYQKFMKRSEERTVNSAWKIDWDFFSYELTVKEYIEVLTKFFLVVSDKSELDSFLSFALSRFTCYTAYQNQFYTMINLESSLNPLSEFRAKNLEGVTNFEEYFRFKHNLIIQDLSQPLIKAVPSKIFTTINEAKKKKNDCSLFLVPELMHLNVPSHTASLLMLLPEILSKFEFYLLCYEYSLMLPCTQRISIGTLSEALTCTSSDPLYNYERLEILGDSFLKYKSSLQVFCSSPGDEGELSRNRQNIISNANLFSIAQELEIGLYANIQRYMPKLYFPPALASLYSNEYERRETSRNGNEKVKERNERAQNERIAVDESGERTESDIMILSDDSDCVVVKEIDSESENENLSNQFEYPFDLNALFDARNTWNALGLMYERDKRRTEKNTENFQQGITLYNSKTLADILEALIAAYLVDCGAESASEFMMNIGLIKCLENRKIEPTDFSIPEDDAIAFQQRLGYEFKNISFLRSAMSPETVNFQRFEFLGDAVLDYVTTRYFYEVYRLQNHEIHNLREAVVNNISYGRQAVTLGLHSYFTDNSGFAKWCESNPLEHFNALPHTAPKILGDTFEAIAGAVFCDLDNDLDKFWRVYEQHLIPFINIHANPSKFEKNPVSELVDLCSQLGINFQDLLFGFVEEEDFKCLISLNGKMLGEASAETKASAKRIASVKAAISLRQHSIDFIYQ